MIASLAERILHLHGWVAVALIFLLAALECSAFLGIIVPGEVAVIVGGVLAFNVAGAVAWGTGFTLLGYFAGASWRQVEHVASRTGLVLLGLIVVGFAVAFVVRRMQRRRSEPPEA